MDKVFKLAHSNFCSHRVLRQLFNDHGQSASTVSYLSILLNERCYSSCSSSISSTRIPESVRCLTQNFRIGGSRPILLEYHRRRLPLHFQMCKFHFDSVCAVKRNIRRNRLDIRRHQESKKHGESLENTNWNLKSDPGLMELYENMKKEMSESELKRVIFGKYTLLNQMK